MKPAPFEYFAPETLPDALALLEEHGEDAKILAGGQSLVPMMNFRLVRPKVLVDINHVAGLSYIRESDGHLRIGAMTRHRDVERSPVVERLNGLLGEAIRHVGHSAIRARGTVGGSIVHADPTAELPLLLAVLDGEVRVVGPRGRRSIKWEEFLLSYFTTSLEPGEICEEVVMPVLSSSSAWGFEEFTHREGDFAIAAVAAVVETDAARRCTTARLAVAGAGPTPVRARAAEQFLAGQPLTHAVLAEAATLVSRDVEPESDLHASDVFRRHLAGTMALRALQGAATRIEQRERRS
jgi:aerobic carbon-monoxide dehydrogenase medium subunit